MTFDMPTVLMCPPPVVGSDRDCEELSRTCDLHQWGERPRVYDAALATAQWDTVRTRLESFGVDVRTLPAREALPDLMFTADTALIDRDIAIISHFKHRTRVGEAQVVADWLKRSEYNVINVPAEFDFEGAGQAVICGRNIFGGWFSHRERVALKWLGEQLDRPVVPLKLASDRFDRLDSCFRPLSDSVALYVPEAFQSCGRVQLEEHIETLIPVPASEGMHLAATAFAVEQNVLVPTGCPKTRAAIEKAGFRVTTVDINAFETLGGTLSGLILRLDPSHVGTGRPETTPASATRSKQAVA